MRKPTIIGFTPIKTFKSNTSKKETKTDKSNTSKKEIKKNNE